MSSNNSILFEDDFEIDAVDPDGKKFEKVSRIVCRGDSYEMDLVLDVHNKLFKAKAGERIKFVLTHTIDLTGAMEDDAYNQTERKTLMDDYEYVMHGTVFQIDTAKDGKDRATSNATIYASFGGLMMSLKGDLNNFNSMIETDTKVYVLIRKAGSQEY